MYKKNYKSRKRRKKNYTVDCYEKALGKVKFPNYEKL